MSDLRLFARDHNIWAQTVKCHIRSRAFHENTPGGGEGVRLHVGFLFKPTGFARCLIASLNHGTFERLIKVLVFSGACLYKMSIRVESKQSESTSTLLKCSVVQSIDEAISKENAADLFQSTRVNFLRNITGRGKPIRH